MLARSNVTGRAYEINKDEWRKTLRAAGLSQKELAHRVGMSVNAMSMKVIGKSEFTVSEWIRIADELHISPLDLIEITEPDGGTSSSVG